MIKLAFLGVGVMGAPMAGHLVKAGYEVTVYNRTCAKALDWSKKYGGNIARTPAEAVQGASFVFACVGADDDLRMVTTGKDGAFQNMAPGSVFIDHTTVSVQVTRELAQIAGERSLGFLDAPVSGGQAGAEQGQLTIMVGGERSTFDKAEPVMKTYAKRVGWMGASGAGQSTKMANQICIAGILQGLSEAINFARHSGLDVKAVIDVISKGAAQSWQMDNRALSMIDGQFDFGFAVDWMRKDLGLVLDEARSIGISVPMTALVDQFYADVQNMGGGRQDTSSLIRRFQG